MNWVPAAAAAKYSGKVDRAKGGSGGDQTEECAAEQCFGHIVRQPRAETVKRQFRSLPTAKR